MKKFIILALILIAILLGGWLYLQATTPRTSAGVRFPLTAAQRALLAEVPNDAESFALVPSAAALETTLRANAVTRDAVQDWEQHQTMPPRWVIGGADLVAWKAEQQTGYALQLDAVRAFLVRIYLMLGSDVDARWNGSTFLVNAPPSTPIAAAELDQLLALGSGLPAGQAMVVQREASRGAFPPIGRPAVSSIGIAPAEIVITSHAAKSEEPVGPVVAKFPLGALLSGTFSSVPRVVEDLDRLFGAHVSELVADGGTIAIYDIDARKLLPRPSGVIVMPKTAERSEAVARLQGMLAPGQQFGVDVRTGETADSLLLSFDRNSIDLYLKDAFSQPRQFPAAHWAARMDPQRLVPVLAKLDGNPGFRIAAPKLQRSARDLNRWIHYLENAKSIEAASTVEGDFDVLAVRIESK